MDQLSVHLHLLAGRVYQLHDCGHPRVLLVSSLCSLLGVQSRPSQLFDFTMLKEVVDYCSKLFGVYFDVGASKPLLLLNIDHLVSLRCQVDSDVVLSEEATLVEGCV